MGSEEAQQVGSRNGFGHRRAKSLGTRNDPNGEISEWADRLDEPEQFLT